MRQIDQNSVKLSTIKRMIENIEKTKGPQLDPDLSLEFILASFFPHVWENMQNDLKDAYTKGFLDGGSKK